MPSAACWMLVASGVNAPTARVLSRAPSRYRFQVRRAVGRRDVVPDVAAHDRGAGDRVVGPVGAVLEVGHQLAARGVDAEEPVHVQVGRGLGLRAALGQERDGARDAARAGARADARRGPLEPQLEGVRRRRRGRVPAPNVTYWLEPLSWTPLPAAAKTTAAGMMPRLDRASTAVMAVTRARVPVGTRCPRSGVRRSEAKDRIRT